MSRPRTGERTLAVLLCACGAMWMTAAVSDLNLARFVGAIGMTGLSILLWDFRSRTPR
jgi:hypothetical protein